MTQECSNIRDRLDAFVDRELDADVSSEVSRHVANCPECTQELNTIRMVRLRLHTAVMKEPVPANLHLRVSAVLRETQPQRASRAWSWLPVASAAMLLLAFGLSWNVYRTWSNPRAAPLAADAYTESLKGRLASVLRVAMTDHIHCGVFRRYPKDPPSRAQMVSDMGPQYKDLIPLVREKVPERYRLEQAHRCTSSGREYVHMIFRDRTALISVIATIRRPGESLSVVPASDGVSSIRSARVDQYQIAAFDAGPFLAYVVSDMPRSNNLVMASVLVSPVSSFLGEVDPVRVF